MLTPHPAICERCKTLKAHMPQRKKDKDGNINERWLCIQCVSAVLDGCEDLERATSNE